MPLLRHLAVLFAFIAAFMRPAPASAFTPASPETRVGGFEVAAQLLVGELDAASREQRQGIGAAYDENASGYRFAAGDVVNASTIRFSQNSIGRTFSSGGTLREAIEGLRSGAISPEAFPPIRVFERNGLTFTLDNRRLFVFQEAGVPIRTVPATAKEIAAEAWKFTTRNEGKSVRVRGDL